MKGSVNIPFVNAKRVWSAEEGKKVVVKVGGAGGRAGG